MKLALAAAMALVIAAPALGQAAPPVTFPQVTGTPLHSVSGRFSSLNPPGQRDCPYKQVSGRVVSLRLILVEQMVCGRPGHDNLLVNVELANAADAAQMVTGRHVVIAARFKRAEEDRDDTFVAGFLIAENAWLVAGDRIDPSAPPAKAFTSYMICQPPELDALAELLGRDLCVQSTVVANLAGMAPALERAARLPEKLSPEDAIPGDPEAISCRLDPGVSYRSLSAIACARNSYWAWYRHKHRDLTSTPAPP